MLNVETKIDIAAPAHTVWAVFDELETHGEWNALTPDIKGRTTLGSHVTTTLVRQNTPDMVVVPIVTRVVAARQLRWEADGMDPAVFAAAHTFTIIPTGPESCTFHNDELFSGAAVAERFESLDVDTRAAYEKMNRDLKARAELKFRAEVTIHPSVNTVQDAKNTLEGAILRCQCATDPVELRLAAACAHNHLCGCSACWKPAGQLMAQVAVVPAGTAEIVAGAQKLAVVNAEAKIKRHACKDCGCHVIGRVEDKDHHFYGLDFIHPELAVDAAAPKPEFAGFVSSLIETGTSPAVMAALRAHLTQAGVLPYDAFSPEIMDAIAWHHVKIARYPNVT